MFWTIHCFLTIGISRLLGGISRSCSVIEDIHYYPKRQRYHQVNHREATMLYPYSVTRNNKTTFPVGIDNLLAIFACHDS